MLFIEFDSHWNRPRKCSPLSLSGSRTEICFRTSMFAPFTPTAKNANALAASPSFTCFAAFSQASVGAPSVIRKIQGR